MKLWKIVLYAAAIVAFASCGTYTQAPKNTIKVLAVTHEGDTIQLDVNSLRPRVYQNIYHTCTQEAAFKEEKIYIYI